MIDSSRVIRPTAPGGQLLYRQVSQAEFVLAQAGVVIGRSDCGYSIWGRADLPCAVERVRLLAGLPTQPLSLAFGSIRQASTWGVLEQRHLRVLSHLSPGGLTLVVEPRRGAACKAKRWLGSPDSLGIRVSSSVVEQQLTNELDVPVTTTALRDTSGHLVTEFAAAAELVESRVRSLTQRTFPWLIVSGTGRFAETTHSTVLALPSNQSVKIIRQGSLSEERIDEAVGLFAPVDYNDWT